MLISRWRKLKSNNVRSLAEIAARVTEVLANLISMAAPDDPLTRMAEAFASLGGMVLERSRESESTNTRRGAQD
jgi:DNA invertase Pin-like site-specific DNA recombinase